ncbi:MAG: flagellar biosynthesis protein FlgA, partial [Rhodospirillales bacterium]
HIVGIADLSPPRARAALASCGWAPERTEATSLGQAIDKGTTFVTDNADAVIDHPGIEVIVEATGDPRAGIRFCLNAIAAGKHIVTVNVEADVVAGPLLAAKARAQGVVYS